MLDYTSKEISDSITVVEVRGQLDESSREYFFGCISDMIQSGARYIVIECQGIGHLNSAALASLLTARKQAIKSGGQIYLTHVSSSIAEVLEITKLGRLLSVYPSTEAALEHIRKASGDDA